MKGPDRLQVITINTADGVLRACGDGARDPGEQCDDGKLGAGDCCSPDCHTASADGSACDDGSPCTMGDLCDSGACFRRRPKTQAMVPSAEAVLLLLFGLLRSGHIRLRRLDGWRDLSGEPFDRWSREGIAVGA